MTVVVAQSGWQPHGQFEPCCIALLIVCGANVCGNMLGRAELGTGKLLGRFNPGVMKEEPCAETLGTGSMFCEGIRN
jgi:hypothetical protein